MKNYLLIALVFIASPLFCWEGLVEGKVGYFRPCSEVLQDTFDNGLPSYQLELSVNPFCGRGCCYPWYNNFFAFGSVTYIYDEGSSLGEEDDTKLHLIPLTLGAKYMQPFYCNTELYASFGGRYYFLHLDYDTEDDIQSDEKARGFGVVFSLGALFHPWRCLVLDFFGDYAYCHFSPGDFTEKSDERSEGLIVGGWTIGIGAGFRF